MAPKKNIKPAAQTDIALATDQLSNEAPRLSSGEIARFRRHMLVWYDAHQRALPWRARPGQRPDPYHVWLSEIMLQQTVVAAVIPYFVKFVDNWPRINDLAAAAPEQVMAAWAGLGYYARARNLHKCAKLITAQYNGVFPQTETALRQLPGIGDYTAAAITAIAFDRPANVVDGNIERVMARYFAITAPLPGSKKTLKQAAALLATGRGDRPGDYAQALMDLGATICIPKAPRCGLCPLQADCRARRTEGLAATLPSKTPKTGRKPQRKGYVYWLRNDQGEILCERRPESGLLGGMYGLPGSSWVGKNEPIVHIALIDEKQAVIDKKLFITHSFTHFDLKLYGVRASYNGPVGSAQRWVRPELLAGLGLPTVFKKFVNLVGDDV